MSILITSDRANRSIAAACRLSSLLLANADVIDSGVHLLNLNIDENWLN